MEDGGCTDLQEIAKMKLGVFTTNGFYEEIYYQ
jgi:hypothetical protein